MQIEQGHKCVCDVEQKRDRERLKGRDDEEG
jgi:hypothetical protein